MKVIKVGIPATVRAVLMATAEIVHARAVRTTIIKVPDVRAIAIEVVPTTIIKIQVVLPAVRVVVTIAMEIQTGVLQEIRDEVLQEIRDGVLQEIRAGVLQEIRAGVLQATVVHKVVPAPIHQTEEVKILPARVAPAVNNPVRVANQAMVGKVPEDVKKVLQKVHRANTTIATRQRIGQAPYSLLFLHY
jgi:hypothetical protein